MSIEHVYIRTNTSAVVDEVFASRLGLIPLNIDPDLMEYNERVGDNAQPNDRNTIIFWRVYLSSNIMDSIVMADPWSPV